MAGQTRQVMAQDPNLTERFELLDSTPGIAETRVIQILAELAVRSPDLEARQGVGLCRTRSAPAQFGIVGAEENAPQQSGECASAS